MLKQKQELTAKQESEKARLRREYMWIFVGGKQKLEWFTANWG